MSRASRPKARQRLVQALYQWQMGGQSVSAVESQFLEHQDLEGADIGYFCELLREIPKSIDAIEENISLYVTRPLAEIDPVETAILRLAVFEFLFRPDVPYRVVLNEAIKLAKSYGGDQGHKFINGVLDKVAQKVRTAEIKTSGK